LLPIVLTLTNWFAVEALPASSVAVHVTVVLPAGKWIVPGYVDAHVHLFDSGSLYTSPDDYDLTRLVPHEEERRRIQDGIEKTLDRFLCSGVTTVASLGGPRFELGLQKSSDAPHVVAAGPFLANFPFFDITLWTREDPVLVQVATPEASRAKVRELSERRRHRQGGLRE
jgi:cytosine/adenosine deaminase-related metal-dependent hydrolase